MKTYYDEKETLLANNALDAVFNKNTDSSPEFVMLCNSGVDEACKLMQAVDTIEDQKNKLYEIIAQMKKTTAPEELKLAIIEVWMVVLSRVCRAISVLNNE